MVAAPGESSHVPRRAFGRTGHDSSRVIFGAAALWQMSQDSADQVLDVLDEFGVNHLDTAASYGDSELRLAPWLATRRPEFFLATKTDERTGVGARSQLERSLARLGVDQVDLIQLHNLVEPDEWELALGPGGAVEALVQAREEGLTRFIGVTGHGLRIAAMHVRSLERFDFDSVLLPANVALSRQRRLSARRRDLASPVRRTAGRGADHQIGGASAVGQRRPASQLVRAAHRSRHHLPRGRLGAG